RIISKNSILIGRRWSRICAGLIMGEYLCGGEQVRIKGALIKTSKMCEESEIAIRQRAERQWDGISHDALIRFAYGSARHANAVDIKRKTLVGISGLVAPDDVVPLIGVQLVGD